MDAYGFAWCAFGRAPDSSRWKRVARYVTLSQHWKDSSGHGRHRGGSGGVQQWMIHKVPNLAYVHGQRKQSAMGQPLFGGYASAPIPGISVRKADLLRANAGGTQSFRWIAATFSRTKGARRLDVELIARTPKLYDEGDLLFGFSGGPAMAIRLSAMPPKCWRI
jgi:acetophenone carboxylase